MKQVVLLAVAILVMTLVVLFAVHKPKSTQPKTVIEHIAGKRSLPGEKLAPHTLLDEPPQYDIEDLKGFMRKRDPFKPGR